MWNWLVTNSAALWNSLTTNSATNSTAVTAMATVAGVAVAAAYAYLTFRLARAANTQAAQGRVLAGAAMRQADAALAQAEASRRGADAAAEQAYVTRQMFEASHRPYLEVRVQGRTFYARPELMSVVVLVKNHGSVPAMLLGWRTDVRVGGQVIAHAESPDETGCIFPDSKDKELECAVGKGWSEARLHPEVDLDIEVAYRGFHPGIRYKTTIGVTGRADEWTELYVKVT